NACATGDARHDGIRNLALVLALDASAISRMGACPGRRYKGRYRQAAAVALAGEGRLLFPRRMGGASFALPAGGRSDRSLRGIRLCPIRRLPAAGGCSAAGICRAACIWNSGIASSIDAEPNLSLRDQTRVSRF